MQLHVNNYFVIALNYFVAQRCHVKKERKAETIRARCRPELKRDIEQIAMLQQLDAADVIRIACAHYIQKFKQGVTSA